MSGCARRLSENAGDAPAPSPRGRRARGVSRSPAAYKMRAGSRVFDAANPVSKLRPSVVECSHETNRSRSAKFSERAFSSCALRDPNVRRHTILYYESRPPERRDDFQCDIRELAGAREEPDRFLFGEEGVRKRYSCVRFRCEDCWSFGPGLRALQGSSGKTTNSMAGLPSNAAKIRRRYEKGVVAGYGYRATAPGLTTVFERSDREWGLDGTEWKQGACRSNKRFVVSNGSSLARGRKMGGRNCIYRFSGGDHIREGFGWRKYVDGRCRGRDNIRRTDFLKQEESSKRFGAVQLVRSFVRVRNSGALELCLVGRCMTGVRHTSHECVEDKGGWAGNLHSPSNRGTGAVGEHQGDYSADQTAKKSPSGSGADRLPPRVFESRGGDLVDCSIRSSTARQ